MENLENACWSLTALSGAVNSRPNLAYDIYGTEKFRNSL